MIDPGRGSWEPGVDPTGDGSALNVRVLSQRCPHLGCRPNPCIQDYWFRCPCHQSRYDRLGIKAAGERFGPASRGMDRYAIEVDGNGVLTVDTTHITLGPAARRARRAGHHPAARRERLREVTLLRLYPGRWRARYGEEMADLLEARSITGRDRLDLVRGAIDAWIHPPTPSRIPAITALIGGGLWTLVAAGVLFQPAPPDWPGYLHEVVPIALVAVAFLWVAVLGCGLRSGDRGGGIFGVTAIITTLGYGSWIAMLALTAAGWADGPGLAAAQTVAIVGTTLIGATLVRDGDTAVGGLITAGGLAMLIPWSAGWLVFGTSWTAVGLVLWLELAARSEPTGFAS